MKQFILLILFTLLSLSSYTQIKAPNKVNSKGERTGKWVLYIDADRYFLDEPDGSEETYYLINYKRNIPQGFTREYDLDGNLLWEAECSSINPDTVNGIAKGYYKNGNVRNEYFKIDNIINGEVAHYYESGQLKWSCHYIDDFPDGLYSEYYENGNLMRQGSVSMGEKEGQFTFYRSDGTIEKIRTYTEDKETGYGADYDTLGRILYDGNMQNGNWHGVLTSFDSVGEASKYYIFYNDSIQELKTVIQDISFSLVPQNITWGIGEWLYLLVTLTLLLVMLFRMGKIYFMRTKYKGVKNGPYTIYEVPSTYSPASFFSMIFLPSGISNDYKNLIIRHEEVHTRQLHSIDVILFEFIKAIFWINPIVHLLERELKLVHEYIADSIACNENRADYSKALLAYNLGVSAQVLTNNFYQLSTIKNRIIMLQKTTSVHSSIFRLLLILPMFLAFSFINSAQAQSTDEVMKEVEIMPEYKGGTDGLFEYLGNEIKYPKKSKDKGEEGKVFVQFTVSKKGKVKDVEVIKGVSELLDAEALRVIKGMDDWTPGENEGKPVNVQMVLPIMFKLPPPPPPTTK